MMWRDVVPKYLGPGVRMRLLEGRGMVAIEDAWEVAAVREVPGRQDRYAVAVIPGSELRWLSAKGTGAVVDRLMAAMRQLVDLLRMTRPPGHRLFNRPRRVVVRTRLWRQL